MMERMEALEARVAAVERSLSKLGSATLSWVERDDASVQRITKTVPRETVRGSIEYVPPAHDGRANGTCACDDEPCVRGREVRRNARIEFARELLALIPPLAPDENVGIRALRINNALVDAISRVAPDKPPVTVSASRRVRDVLRKLSDPDRLMRLYDDEPARRMMGDEAFALARDLRILGIEGPADLIQRQLDIAQNGPGELVELPIKDSMVGEICLRIIDA